MPFALVHNFLKIRPIALNRKLPSGQTPMYVRWIISSKWNFLRHDRPTLMYDCDPKGSIFCCLIKRPFLETPLVKLKINSTNDRQLSYKLVSQINVSFTWHFTLLWSIRSLARLIWKMAEWQLAGWKGGMLGHVYKEYAWYNLLDFLGHSNFLLSCLLSNGRNRLEGDTLAITLLSWFTRYVPPIFLGEREARSLPLAPSTSACFHE